MIRFQCLNKSCNFEQYYDDDNSPAVCPDCDGKWYRLAFCKDDVQKKDKPYSGLDATMRGPERWSTSMGVPANQVEQFSKRFPDSVYSPDGKLLIKNRADKKRQMKERFMIEYD